MLSPCPCHHRSPAAPVPFCALQLRQIAPEYYNTLYAHTSWCWVLWRFLVDPSMGPWSRMHRVIREGTPAGNTKFVSSRCSTAALSTPQDAARSAEVLGASGSAALQVSRLQRRMCLRSMMFQGCCQCVSVCGHCFHGLVLPEHRALTCLIFAALHCRLPWGPRLPAGWAAARTARTSPTTTKQLLGRWQCAH